MKTITAARTIALKSGEVIIAGATLTFVRPVSDTVGTWLVNGAERNMRYTSLVKTPSTASLEKWVESGVCKSVFGTKTEVDGTGAYGEPSWALCLGLC